ncbi:hypothetical protein ACFFHT_07200 [Gallibacterium melopsittaci]|uniref:Uncharacterized protein n=1 Tax=Gallibacterium melopsittaci TaxID=516063 RepID=A0ABV6HWT9_9PAST
MNTETNIQKTQQSYDELPYQSKPFSLTYPDKQKGVIDKFVAKSRLKAL